ncbi:MAG: ATP-grasp domain-containing protein [Alphaproteobacteria bacterium]
MSEPRSGGARPTWIVQEAAFAQRDFDALRIAVMQIGCRFESLRIVPFSHELIGTPPEISGPCFVYGSSGMMTVARRFNWEPGGWDGPAFSSTQSIRELGSLALNSDAIWAPYSEAADIVGKVGWESAFIRPDSETKEFAGEVKTIHELEADVARLRETGYFNHENNTVLIARPRSLHREWRAFVVDGSIVDTSLYSFAGSRQLARGAPADVLAALSIAVATYSPAPAFVVDVAEVFVGNGIDLKIVEYNSINSSGFYAYDVSLIASAVTDLISKWPNI